MDSDTFGIKRRITEVGDTQETLIPPHSSPQSPTSLCPKEDKEEHRIAENKNLSFLFDSKKAKASQIINEENQELGFAPSYQQSGEVLDSLASGNVGFVKIIEDFSEVQNTEDFEAGYVCDGEKKQEKVDFLKGWIDEIVKESSPSGFDDKEEEAFVKNEVRAEVGSAVEEDKEELRKEVESVSLLKVRKKQVLEELHTEKVSNFVGSLTINVIDQTALIDFNENFAERKGSKNVKQEVNGKKTRRGSRRKARKILENNERPENVLLKGESEIGCRKKGDHETDKVYTRKEIEGLRFGNIIEQRKLWKKIYHKLGAAVAREYDDLASSRHRKHIPMNLDPRQLFSKNKEVPAILSKPYYFLPICGSPRWK